LVVGSGCLQPTQPSINLIVVPPPAKLIFQVHQLSDVVQPGVPARVLQEQERQQAAGLMGFGHELHEEDRLREGGRSEHTCRMPASSSSPPAAAVLSGLDAVREWAADVYRDLHLHPELSHRKHATASKVAGRLKAAGIEVHPGVGGTGVVGLVRNGEGPVVLLRADMDALPVAEATGLPYASQATDDDGAGGEVPVMHACGHDMHVACLLGAAHLLAAARDEWAGSLVLVFQPAEETGDGARGMVEDGLAALVPRVDVALAQHVLPAPAGRVGTHVGPTLSAADSMRVTVHGRGAHGSMPQAAVDPVVLAAMIVVRLQTIVARETRPGEPVVVTVGSIRAGTKSNVISDHAVIELNVRTYSEETRTFVLDAIHRIVDAECQASACPRPAEYELFDRFPLTANDPDATQRVAAAFSSFFGDRAGPLPLQTASEDFSDIPSALGVPYCYWGIGGTDAEQYQAAERAGRVAQDIPVNHSAHFAPVIQPTLDTGIQALVVAALAWLAPPPADQK
jgi:hippurate hydrolase